MNIGLLGFGVVGRGVYDMLAGRDDIRAAWVLCRRDLGELTARTTYEMQDILDDPAVDTVVEVMGGLHPAYEYVAAALRAGKNVVSSNKYLMCRYYDELTALAKEHGAALRCTAAVGGGIPWLTNLEKAARANHISRVWGILNGTTNYIMDAMHGSDVDFADVLAQAQASVRARAATRRLTTSCRTSWTSRAACTRFTPIPLSRPCRTIPACSTATTCARAPRCQSWPPSPRATGTAPPSRSPCP